MNTEPTGRALSPKAPQETTTNGAGRARSPSAPQPSTQSSGRAVSPKPPHPSPDGAFGERALPSRRKLPHEIPNWVADNSIYFITINCAQRNTNQLAHPAIAAAIEESLLHRQAMHQWWIHYFLVMPDHIHALISFGRETSMRRVISDWKRHLARSHAIEWQRDFFDHRLRNAAALTDKWQYIRHNPVRKNLVTDSSQWPYQWHYGATREEKIETLPTTEGRARSPNAPQPSKDVENGGFGEAALPAA